MPSSPASSSGTGSGSLLGGALGPYRGGTAVCAVAVFAAVRVAHGAPALLADQALPLRLVSAPGGGGLTGAADRVPDLIVMDLSLPIMDGWEATKRLRADARTTSIPVIVLTGHALSGTSDAAKNLGCDAFVVKPCLPEALEREIRRLLEQPAGPSQTNQR